MKKIVLLIFSVLLLSSCFFLSDKNEEGLKVTNNTEKNNKKNSTSTGLHDANIIEDYIVKQINTKEEFYEINIPDDFSIKDEKGDLLNFYKLINRDSDFFEENPIEKEFYDIWRFYLYKEKVDFNNIEWLSDCLDWEISFNELIWNNKLICKWENRYIENSSTNYFHIKDTLIKMKKIKEWSKFSCNYFLKDNYDLPKLKLLQTKINSFF